MLRQGLHPLTDAASGRMSMPFLPTLAVVIALAAASVFCPSSQEKAAPVETVSVAAPGPTALAEPAAFAAPAPAAPAPARLPASLAFAEAFPLASPPAAGTLRATTRARAGQHLASIAGKPCPGRGCPEVPHRAAALPPPEADPLAVARAGQDPDAGEDGFLPPIALPFAAVAQSAMVRTLAPAVRVVGEAASLVGGDATSVRGSIALLADCLP